MVRREVSYKHLRVFGCRAFVLVPKDERSKLDSKTKQYISMMSLATDCGILLVEKL